MTMDGDDTDATRGIGDAAERGDAPGGAGETPVPAEGARPPFRAIKPVRNIRGKRRVVKPRPHPDLGPVGPLSPTGEPGKPRPIPLREEFCAICQGDGGGADLKAALVLQQFCHMQAHRADKAEYVAEETHHAKARPRRLRGGKAGWFQVSASELSTRELLGAIGPKSVERAILRLQEIGVVQVRSSMRSNQGEQANEYRVDAVRLAELLAGAGYRLPANEWGPKGLGFDPATVSPEAGPAPSGPAGSHRGDDEPARQNDEAIGQIDEPRFVTVTNEESEDRDILSENPLPPGGESSSSSFDPAAFDPADVARWQDQSMARLPARCSEKASMDFVRQAPVARIFPALYRRFPGWTPALARSFAKRVKNGRVTVARLLACLLARTPVLEPMRFLNDEFLYEGMTERVHFLEERAIVAEKVLLAQPDARDLLGDLAQEADQWREREERSLAMSEHTILEKHPVDGLLEHNGFSQIQHRDALLLSIARLHPSMVLPVETSDADRVRESILESCAVSGRIREVVLEMDPEFLRIRVGLTPDDILQRANGHRDNLFRQWARWLAVSAALR